MVLHNTTSKLLKMMYVLISISQEIERCIIMITLYGAQNEAYMSRSAEKWVRGLCFNELGVCG